MGRFSYPEERKSRMDFKDEILALIYQALRDNHIIMLSGAQNNQSFGQTPQGKGDLEDADNVTLTTPIVGQVIKIATTAPLTFVNGSSTGSGAVLHRASTIASGGVWETAVVSSRSMVTLPSAYKMGSAKVWRHGLMCTPGTDYSETDPATGILTMTEQYGGQNFVGDNIAVEWEEP